MMYVKLMKNFHLACWNKLLPVRLELMSSCTSRLMYVELMKNFHLADSSELLTVRLLSDS